MDSLEYRGDFDICLSPSSLRSSDRELKMQGLLNSSSVNTFFVKEKLCKALFSSSSSVSTKTITVSIIEYTQNAVILSIGITSESNLFKSLKAFCKLPILQKVENIMAISCALIVLCFSMIFSRKKYCKSLYAR